MSRLLNRSMAHRLLSPALVAGARERHRVLRVETSLPQRQENPGGFQGVTPYESAHDGQRPRKNKQREPSRSDPGSASRHARGNAPHYAAPDPTPAAGDQVNGP